MKRRTISLVINILIALLALRAWIGMAFSIDDSGRLSAAGLASLKYFTVLSNLLQGVASALYAAYLTRIMRGRIDGLPRWLGLLKYAAAVSVMLTFLTVMAFLGPVFGFETMFTGANLWFHLVIPLAAALDFCLMDREGSPSPRDARIAVIPMLLYGVGYVLNLLINGVGEWPDTNDWYGFAAGGAASAAVAFAVILLGTWLIALALRLPRRRGST